MEQVDNLINCLTSDEDLKQELWVHFLSGNPIESFSTYFKKLKTEQSDDIRLQQAMWLLIKEPISEEFSSILEDFSDYECSILCCLFLGMSIKQISSVKGINEVRIKQTIHTIRYNPLWGRYCLNVRNILK